MDNCQKIGANKKRRNTTKWEPSRIELVPVKILREEKDNQMNEVVKILMNLKEKFNQTMEVYET
ncbi:MAG: hypothetical protein CME65_16205 [Halobacteriovoraceae bacterium]|nr:hypothetical protein [Halobacteriovoraceae bacterium]|tara:strand:+ start:3883 stop:4074 length:192 start_codon:yes stop_codon:yes gene_type:complete